MLDINFIKENKEQVQAAITNKKVKMKVNLDEVLKLDETRRKNVGEIEEIRRQKNLLNDKVKNAKEQAEREGYITESRELSEKEKKLNETFNHLDQELTELMLQIPNVTSPKMPIGKDDSDNVVARKWGEPTKFDFEPLDHVELGKRLDLIEIDKAGEISGARFYYLKNEAVLMQFGIVQMVFEGLSNPELLERIAKQTGNPYTKAFSPIVPPVMMKPEIMKKMDRLDPIEERYELKNDDLILVGSAEHTLGPLHMNETIKKEDLPIRYIGYSSAFRREAGSYGKDTRGILRTHQFDKLEIESYVPAEYGEVEQEFIVAFQEYFLQQLEIPYQVIQICTGDTGKPDYNQYDIDSWIPTQNKYRETHTSDYMTNFQARRLNIRYIDTDGSKKYVHMNDATAFAIGRITIAILENHQQADGSVRVPKALQKYVGKEIIKR